MSDITTAAKISLPAYWVPLADVLGYLASRFSIGSDLLDGVQWDLHVDLLRSRPWIVHRIPDFRFDWGPPGAFSETMWSPTDIRTTVKDWSKAGFNPAAGTVAGVDKRTGEPKPIPVELLWTSVEEWFEHTGYRKMWQRERRGQTKAQLGVCREDQEVSSEAKGAPKTRNSPKAKFSEQALGGWFVFQVHTWPEDKRLPTEKEDLDAALEVFAEVPREVFRKVRREKTPRHGKDLGLGKINGTIGSISAI